jgi:hypothetical protein
MTSRNLGLMGTSARPGPPGPNRRGSTPVISEYVQQWTAIEAVSAACFSPAEVWESYRDIGGTQDQLEVVGYLAGIVELSALDRDLISHAVNEMILDRDLPVEGAHYSSTFVAEGSGFADTLRGLILSSEEHPLGRPGPADSRRWEPLYCADDRSDGCGDQDRADEDQSRRNWALLETGVLNAGAEERFDRITAEVREHFAVSWAFIVLIPGDCHIIKSLAGPDEQDLPWVYDLCARTLETGEAFVVADTAASQEFSDDAPAVRFYAGHPLHTTDGWPVGTLCLIDDQPGGFSTEDAWDLMACAARVEIEIAAGSASN